jgi:hypothetical protein
VRNVVRRFGAITATLRITEEPNVGGNAVLDGDYPDVLGAIVAGVAAANDEARSCGLDHIGVGVNTTPLFGASSGFYAKLVGIGGQALRRAACKQALVGRQQRQCLTNQLLIGATGFDERLQPGQLPAEHSVDDRGDVAKTAGAEAADRVNQFDRRSAAGLQ